MLVGSVSKFVALRRMLRNLAAWMWLPFDASGDVTPEVSVRESGSVSRTCERRVVGEW